MTKLDRQIRDNNIWLDKVRQKDIVVNLEKSKPEINPKNVMGWDVQQSKDGYYLCYRKQVNTILHT